MSNVSSTQHGFWNSMIVIPYSIQLWFFSWKIGIARKTLKLELFYLDYSAWASTNAISSHSFYEQAQRLYILYTHSFYKEVQRLYHISTHFTILHLPQSPTLVIYVFVSTWAQVYLPGMTTWQGHAHQNITTDSIILLFFDILARII